MKPTKSPSNNGKVYDFFTKIPNKAQKRKTPDSSSTNDVNVLAQITNLDSTKIENNPPSPSGKKLKCDENFFAGLTTPEKQLNNPSNSKSITPSGKNRTPSRQGRQTPSKMNKRGTTPKKLFEKSPRKLEEFNVEILEKFVKVTPSKSNRICSKDSTPTKINGALQTSIIQYMSPSSSEINLIRGRNETTPTKSPQKIPHISPGRSKVKTKIDFDAEKRSPSNGHLVLEDTFDDILDGFDEADFSIIEVDSLDLSQPLRCSVVLVTKSASGWILRLKSNNESTNCSVQEFWSSCEFQQNSTIVIQASKRKDNSWFVDNNNGFIVYEPDLLVSCTSLVRNIYCKRKSLITERFQGFDPSNKVMLIGNLVHSLLQDALKNKINTMKDLEDLLVNTLKDQSIARKLYECDVTLDDIQSEILQTYIPKMHDFLKQYIRGAARKDPQNWTGSISSIDDIEDNFWCPSLGLKGKIDVTVKTDKNELVPLELKTGRASMSLEHRAQVILYIMMMNKLGFKVSSGLLLYLKEGVLKDIAMTASEQRDIMILRNDFTYFLTQKVVRNGDTFRMPKLPEPILYTRGCARCEKNVICTAYLRHENHDYGTSSLKEIEKEATAHLSDEHLSYFVHWSTLLHLELESKTSSKNLQEIYTIPPEVRQESGRCLINLKIESVAPSHNGIFEHIFVKNTKNTNEAAKNFLTSGILENNYIIISTDSRMAIAMGFVSEISANSISVSLDRNLNTKYKSKLFHLDTYDSTSVQSFNFNSLAILLENTERSEQLRKIVINKAAPVFAQKLPAVIAKHGKAIFKKLNRVQQKAVLTALSSQDFILIKGMPGTGKTSTIIALIQLLILLKKTVLITSHTHSAVDNVCLRLKQVNVDFIRLGAENKIDKRLKEHCEFNLMRNCHKPEELDAVYNKYNVIGVTCLGSGHPMLSKREIDVCIIDESTQVHQPTLIRPISLAKRFILIGDPDQLSPVVRNQEALTAGLGESLFERLDKAHSKSTVTLSLNYRMNKTISNLANGLTYNGELLPANEAVANARLLIDFERITSVYEEDRKWVLQAMNCDLEYSVQFIDTGPVWKLEQVPEWYTKRTENESNLCNFYELGVVVTLVEALIRGGVAGSGIGVMATYTAQVVALSQALEKFNVQVNTVDQFQGQDKSVIVYSCTKSKDMSLRSDDLKFDILEDKRRLTVAITRAKHKLLLVGDKSTLGKYSTFSTIFTHIPNTQVITLNEQNYDKIGYYLK